MNKILIQDTTLRDGLQSPGISVDLEGTLAIAKALEDLNVDIIEAGFPASGSDAFQSVNQISHTIKHATIRALCRCLEKDIDVTAEALAPARSSSLFLFIATSPIHMHHKLKKSADTVYEQAVSMVHYARRLNDNIVFAAEDAGRTNFDFLCRIIEGVIKAGATTITIPDTVGYLCPNEYKQLIERLRTTIPNADQAIFSTHCHDDLGMAVANTLAGIEGGARQVECTINGIGERAGNAALEEVVMALKTRKDYYGVEVNINTKKLCKTSKTVSQITAYPTPKNKAIVGKNAFAHESGIHQDGILKNPHTYEIIDPNEVGWDYDRIILGKRSGLAGTRHVLEQYGIDRYDDRIHKAFLNEIKNLPVRKLPVLPGTINQILEKIKKRG